jgi:FkbM family methyltransferase
MLYIPVRWIKAVYANTLDSLLQKNGINKVNWIKIGIQGKELDVLQGARIRYPIAKILVF